MPEPKEPTSFFRKVVKFVANPATDWTELGTPTEEARETEFAKGELKAMIERKRRNDFVRKREFDTLRKVRREGLTGEQLAALGGSSRLDDSEAKMGESGAKAESGVKAKIDEIEQQMVGDATYAGGPRRTDFDTARTQPAALNASSARRGEPHAPRPGEPFRERPLSSPSFAGHARATPVGAFDSTRRDGLMADRVVPLAHSPVVMGAGTSPLSKSGSIEFDMPEAEPARKFVQEATDIAHDPELDEAVISFANADFEHCEQAISALTSPGGTRAQHAQTWLVLFDLYRAIGQQQRFESRAIDYVQQFGWSAPQWFSMPKLVAEATAAEERPERSREMGQTGWVCPEHVDAEAVAVLASASLQMPLPWVFDWSALASIDAEGCARLSELMRNWMLQPLDIRWLGGEQLFTVLQEAAPNGARDADPAYWQLRLDALRMANRPDQFDEAAIDYCVTYEVSPPSWEPVRCEVRVSGSGSNTASQPLSVVSEVATSFLESDLSDDPGTVQVGTVELSGQLIGDIGVTLRKMDAQLGAAAVINVSCTRLIRVDFIAAGDLLNWVLSRRSENRSVRFIETHRLIALFFGAMGINEHATVKVRNV